MKKIVILDSYSLNPGDLSFEEMNRLGEVTIYDRTSSELIYERVKGNEIIITNKTELRKDVLEKCPEVKYIGVFATGYNIIDIDYCKNNNIVVTNIPSYGTDAVAQHVFALLLELTNHVGEHSVKTINGKWAKSKDFCFWDKSIISLSGKTMGIIGAGKIGLKTGEIARAFGMNVIYTNSSEDVKKISDKVSYDTLNNLLLKSDVVSLHCPLTNKTSELINRKSLSKMKKHAFLINTSRGGLINEKNLYDALDKNIISGSGIDVLSIEPPVDNILLKAKNIIITPHIAWAAKEARERLLNTAIENIKGYISGDIRNNVAQ